MMRVTVNTQAGEHLALAGLTHRRRDHYDGMRLCQGQAVAELVVDQLDALEDPMTVKTRVLVITIVAIRD